jgi:Oxaloacetate decarboxylase, gamma chain
MQAFMLLAATEDTAHSHAVLDALPHMAGMLLVMITLAFLWGVCALTASIIKLLLRDQKTASVTTASPALPLVEAQLATVPPPALEDESGIPPEIVAVIAAAVATITRHQPVRIVSIKPMSTSWERAGRQSVLTSHRIR